MKTPILRIIFALLFFSWTAVAQESDCYKVMMTKGIKAFNNKQYVEALDKFDHALEDCDGVTIENTKLVRSWKEKTRDAIRKMISGYKESIEKAQYAEQKAQYATEQAKKALEEMKKASEEAQKAKLKVIEHSAELKAKNEDIVKYHKEEIASALKQYDIEKAKEELKQLEQKKLKQPKLISQKDIDSLYKEIKTIIDELTPEMVDVKGETFTMGCTGKDCNDSPQHQRVLTSFRIGKSEVTQGLWKKVMGKDNIPFHFYKCGDECPVESVNYEQISVFIRELCKKTGKKFRLPTEAEWEYAAIGGHKANQIIAKKKDFEYSGNYPMIDYVWVKKKITSQVRNKKPNQLGIYDMSGNVMEWCENYYNYDDYRFYIKTKGKLDPPQSQKKRLEGKRVVRGGAFDSDTHLCKVTTRHHQPENTKSKNLGFRLVQELDEKK